jgi:AcrR family transcriptional regulator
MPARETDAAARRKAAGGVKPAPAARARKRLQRSSAEAAARDTPPLAELRRRQILDAAEQCFIERGFHAASMAEIARTFGMSAGHIYNWFDSKEAIIAAIVERDLSEFMQQAAQMMGEPDAQAALLVRVDQGVTNTLDERRSRRQFEVLAEAGRNPQVLAAVRAADARVRGVLSDLFRRTSAGRGRDLEARVTVLMALFEGLMIRSLRQPEVPRTQVTRVLRDAIAQLFSEHRLSARSTRRRSV